MKGILNIHRVERDTIANVGVYDAAFIQHEDSGKWPRLRRFSSEQEVSEFLKDLGLNPDQVRTLVQALAGSGHLRLEDVEISNQLLRGFGLWEESEAA
jgi:hypothetical protein